MEVGWQLSPLGEQERKEKIRRAKFVGKFFLFNWRTHYPYGPEIYPRWVTHQLHLVREVVFLNWNTHLWFRTERFGTYQRPFKEFSTCCYSCSELDCGKSTRFTNYAEINVLWTSILGETSLTSLVFANTEPQRVANYPPNGISDRPSCLTCVKHTIYQETLFFHDRPWSLTP